MMGKAKKEEKPREENEVPEEVIAEKNGDTSDASVREIPIGDGESDESAEPEVAEEVDPVMQLQTRVADLEDQKLRALAEADNHRKRMARQFETVTRAANDRLLGEFLDVVDNLERALEHDAANGNSEDTNGAAVREGTALIHQQMLDLLTRHQVRPIDAVGRPFDAAWHEALMQVASDEYDEGIVVSEIRKGYMIGDRVLRHARVAVSRPPEDDEPSVDDTPASDEEK